MAWPQEVEAGRLGVDRLAFFQQPGQLQNVLLHTQMQQLDRVCTRLLPRGQKLALVTLMHRPQQWLQRRRRLQRRLQRPGRRGQDRRSRVGAVRRQSSRSSQGVQAGVGVGRRHMLSRHTGLPTPLESIKGLLWVWACKDWTRRSLMV